ncbi:MAG: hypothetical protein EKK48_24175 [Candidatus Melainabacteria bacterium]|jgi:hypothetical protein|nr:MAG: hypothetical protein EKK48_24175 [Candidatus Melainabacteria bacterium]
MQTSQALLANNPNATRKEKAIIRLLAERAQKACPGVKIRFVQRDIDAPETLLIVGLQTPITEAAENYALFAVPHELSEQYENIVLTVTQRVSPIEGKQLLKIRKLLNKDQLAKDLIEPAPISLRKRIHDLTWDSAALVIWILLFVVGYATGTSHPHTPPKIDRAQLTPPPVKTVEETVNEAMRRIDEEMANNGTLRLTPEQLQKLQESKINLGKALKNLTHVKYPELETTSPGSSKIPPSQTR